MNAPIANQTPNGGSLHPDGSASRTLNLYVIDYEDSRGEHWHTVVEAYTQRGARWKFSRDNPDVTVLSCV